MRTIRSGSRRISRISGGAGRANGGRKGTCEGFSSRVVVSMAGHPTPTRGASAWHPRGAPLHFPSWVLHRWVLCQWPATRPGPVAQAPGTREGRHRINVITSATRPGPVAQAPGTREGRHRINVIISATRPGPVAQAPGTREGRHRINVITSATRPGPVAQAPGTREGRHYISRATTGWQMKCIARKGPRSPNLLSPTSTCPHLVVCAVALLDCFHLWLHSLEGQ